MNVKNPAAWLLGIFGKLANYDGPGLAGWAATFGYKGPTTETLNSLRAVDFEARRTEQLIRLIHEGKPRIVEVRLAWRSAWTAAYEKTASGEGWAQIRKAISPQSVESLRNCEADIDSYADDSADEKEFKNLIGSIQELENQIRDEKGLDDQERMLLLDLLQSLRDAIQSFQYRGEAGVRDVYADVIAQLTRARNRDHSPTFWERAKNVYNVTSGAMKVVSYGYGAVKAVGAAKDFILPLF